MSVYASLDSPDESQHTDDCAIWEKHEDYWEHSDRPCDCGQPDAPIAYRGSHILPEETDERKGWVDIAVIPGHVRFWRENPDAPSDDEPDWPNIEPFLRLGVNSETVVLTERQVGTVHASLGEFLDARRRMKEGGE